MPGARIGLVIGLGNPILSDDAVGLCVVDRLNELFRDVAGGLSSEPYHWRFITFDGNPFDLVSSFCEVDVIVIIDSWYPNDGGPVTVSRFDRAVRPSFAAETTSHGINVAEVLTLARELELASPSEAWLVLIPVDDPYVLGQNLSPEASKLVERVVEYIWLRWLHPAVADSSTVAVCRDA